LGDPIRMKFGSFMQNIMRIGWCGEGRHRKNHFKMADVWSKYFAVLYLSFCYGMGLTHFYKTAVFFTFITEIINDLLGGCNKCCCVVVAHHCSSVQNHNAWFPLLLEDSGTQRTALLRKHFPLDNNVAKKVGNAIACGSHPQVRKCRRHAGGIAMRCVVSCYGILT